ncbi:hypothetical protein J6590_070217 [Homalodisca vitripennis]|nr:hypothetical protein J6590_070217 [Homalodisca vitripennis]
MDEARAAHTFQYSALPDMLYAGMCRLSTQLARLREENARLQQRIISGEEVNINRCSCFRGREELYPDNGEPAPRDEDRVARSEHKISLFS